MRSLNIYTRKYFTFVCLCLGSRRGEVMTASICILIITRKNDHSGNLAKKTLPSRMLQVSSCQVIWTDPPLACTPAQWRYYLRPFIDFNLLISVFPPIFRYFKYILHVHVIYENVSTKGPPLVWEVQEQWSYNGTMMQDLCLNARRCHTLGPRLLILVK